MSKSRLKIFGALLFTSFLFISLTSYGKELKVGVVDVEKIYTSYNKAKATAEEIKKEKDAKQAELTRRQDELKKLVDEYNSKKDKLKDKEKQDMEKKISDKRTEVLNFARTTNEQLNKKNREEVEKRLNEIASIIQTYAKNNGYDIIVDKKSLPFFSDTLNVTEEIIKILNK